jgi:assimilatory nitrate reductase catalytic subunit
MPRLTFMAGSSPLVVFRAATEAPIEANLIAELDQMFGMAGDEGAIVYADASAMSAKKPSPMAGCLAYGWLARPWRRPG